MCIFFFLIENIHYDLNSRVHCSNFGVNDLIVALSTTFSVDHHKLMVWLHKPDVWCNTEQQDVEYMRVIMKDIKKYAYKEILTATRGGEKSRAIELLSPMVFGSRDLVIDVCSGGKITFRPWNVRLSEIFHCNCNFIEIYILLPEFIHAQRISHKNRRWSDRKIDAEQLNENLELRSS